jgi:thiol-disulfide isomerase/thioredoxin
MNLQENIHRIKQIMGLLTEDEVIPTTSKVINVSGYDLSKVNVPKIPVGQYPISFHYKTDYVKQKTTAILDDGFVYFMVGDSLGQENIYKVDKGQFEAALTEKQNTPEPLEIIKGPVVSTDKPSKMYKKLKHKIISQSNSIKNNSEIDLTNVPKIELTTTMQGKSYVFDIWASFCAPCRKKINEVLNPLNNELSLSGLTFFYYSVDRDIIQLKEYVEDNLNYATHAFDNKGFESDIFKTYNILGIPRTYFVDKDGNLYTLPETLEKAKDLIIQHL